MDELMTEIFGENMTEIFKSKADPNGSYTGTSDDEDMAVTQDVDDL